MGLSPYQIGEIAVHGTDDAIGAMHAEAVGEAIHEGMPQFYFNFWQRMTTPDRKDYLSLAQHRGSQWFLDRFVIRNLHRQVPKWAFERIEGLCRVSGRSPVEMSLALILPDLFPMFQSWLTKASPQTFVRPAFPPQFGCSSFFKKEPEKLWFGRNLDFPGVSYWDRFPVIQVTHPKGCLKYISFTSAGVPFGGITGVNEAQISVALHQHYSKQSSMSGKLPFLIAEEILQRATTLDAAKSILQKSDVATAWAFLIGNGRTKEAFIYETFAGGGELNSLTSDSLSHSNHFQTPRCRQTEFATTMRMNWDNVCRRERMAQLLSAHSNPFTPELGATILSDHFDPFWGEEKVSNRTVSQLYNIQSIQFDLTDMKAWMAEGESPIHLGSYVEFDLGEMLSGRKGRTGQSIRPYFFKNESIRSAKKLFTESFCFAFDGKYISAEAPLKEAISNYYSPELALILAILQMKRHEFGEAIKLLNEGTTYIENKLSERRIEIKPPEYFEILVYLARAFDLNGMSAEAKATYHRIVDDGNCTDENIMRIARQARPYRLKDLKKILMPYASYIPFR